MFRMVVVSLLVTASPMFADDLAFFHSPTRNIQCMIAKGDYAEARCDVMELTSPLPEPPTDCDLDYGHAFTIGLQSTKGARACVGDTVADPLGATLNYGARIELGGFICASEKTGMTCTNPAGHGFTVAKARQSLF